MYIVLHIQVWKPKPTCSSFIIKDTSWGCVAISSKLSISLAVFLCCTWLFSSISVLVLSPNLVLKLRPSTPKQLLSAEAGRGANSDMKESLGPREAEQETGRRGCAKSMHGMRMTPARVLSGIQQAKQSAWEYCRPAGDDMVTVLPQPNPRFNRQIMVTS